MTPARILIDAEGTAVPPRRAALEHQVYADVVFERADGWTLGAPAHLIDEAEALWANEWIKVHIGPATYSIEDWRKFAREGAKKIFRADEAAFPRHGV